MDINAIEETADALMAFAAVLANYKKDLLAAGFTEIQAFELVRDYQKMIMTPAQKNK